MINFFKNIGNGTVVTNVKPVFMIQTEEWTHEDIDDIRTIVALPHFKSLLKLLHKRMNKRTEDLVNGKETRDRIDEIRDLILELDNYANP